MRGIGVIRVIGAIGVGVVSYCSYLLLSLLLPTGFYVSAFQPAMLGAMMVPVGIAARIEPPTALTLSKVSMRVL